MRENVRAFYYYPWQRKLFVVFNYLFLTCAALICVLPILNILAISLSSSAAAGSGEVRFWPVDFTWKSYNFVTAKPEFMQSFWVSVRRVLVGVPVNMVLTILVAYPLSKTKHQFHARQFYVWFFFITMLFSGGLIPYYMTISKVGLVDSFWALILPGAVPVYNVIILLNFFRNLPGEIEEAARVDGASYLRVLFQIDHRTRHQHSGRAQAQRPQQLHHRGGAAGRGYGKRKTFVQHRAQQCRAFL